MTNKYLAMVSLAMIVFAGIGLGTFYVMRGGLPPVPDWDWPREVNGKQLDEAAQRVEVETLRAKANGVSRFLAGSETSRRFDAAKPTGSGDQFNSKYDTRQFFEAARFHASTVIILWWILLACGLLGLARLKVRGLVAVGGGILTLALLGGGALLVFTGAGTLGGLMLAVMLVSFFGQLIAANLMVDANHPFVLQAEEQLRALPPERRKSHIAKRIAIGIVMLALGGVLTVAAIAIGAGRVVVVPTGLIAVGLFSISTPLIASISLRIRSRVSSSS